MRNFNWGLKLLWKYFLFIFQKTALPTGFVPAAKLSWVQVPAEALSSSLCRCSVTKLCLTLCDPMDCSTPGLHVHHQLLGFTQIHVHWVSDVIQLSHPLSSPSPPALNLSQHHGLFNWVSSSHQVAEILGFQLQHQSFQWIPRTNLL